MSSPEPEVRVDEDVTVVTVPPGSLIVLRNVRLVPEVEQHFADEVARVTGHDRFVIVFVDAESDVRVVGPDEDLAATVRGMLGEASA